MADAAAEKANVAAEKADALEMGEATETADALETGDAMEMGDALETLASNLESQCIPLAIEWCF